jgi:DNA polymerase V
MTEAGSETEEIFRGSRVLMITQQAFYNGEFDFPSPFLFPLVGASVSAGFPSPADDYIETSIDLNRELVRHPFATFFVRASGDSMIGAGIKPNATLVVDRAIETKSGDVVIARIGDEMCVKELFIDEEGKILLVPKNDNYKAIEITEDMDFEIWGKVVCSINKH